MKRKNKGSNTVIIIAIATLFVLSTVTIFAASTSVNGRQLYQFTDGLHANPQSTLVADARGNLYGTTVDQLRSGTDTGSIYSWNVATNQVVSVHGFCGLSNCGDGYLPAGDLSILGNQIFGVTDLGGANDEGTVFQLDLTSQQLTVLYSFGSQPNDGYEASGGVIPDTTGLTNNLYGTTMEGGSQGGGTLYAVDRTTHQETVLWDFCATTGQSCDTSDGNEPQGELYIDKAGNVYGTAASGGSGGVFGFGTVFEYVPATGKLVILHTFSGARDGENPTSRLVADSAGNLYGATENTVFQLTPTYKVIYNTVSGQDGDTINDLTFDRSGALWGTAQFGGTHDAGTVFRLTNSGGVWRETFNHSFLGRKDGRNPRGGMYIRGNQLYGSTFDGGDTTSCELGCGTIFRLTE